MKDFDTSECAGVRERIQTDGRFRGDFHLGLMHTCACFSASGLLSFALIVVTVADVTWYYG